MPPRILRFFDFSARRTPCAELRQHASEYLEADIPEAEKERIRRHLEECDGCKSFVETLRSTITMLRGLPTQAVPPSLKERLNQVSRGQSHGQD